MITYFMTSSRTFGSEKASSRAKSPKWVSGPPPIFSRRSELLTQVLYENLLQTLLGGVLGLFFSYASVLLLSDWLLDTGTASMGIGRTFVNAEMMFNPLIFLYAFLACLALNLLSAGIPAWRASRMRIISALNENVH